MIFLFFFLIWCFFESGLGAVFVSIILIDLFFFVFLEICSRITFCLGIWFHKVCNECHFGLFFHFFNITLKKAENDGLYPYVLKSCLWCSYRWHVYKQTVYEPTSNITEHSGMSSESWTLLICWVQPPPPWFTLEKQFIHFAEVVNTNLNTFHCYRVGGFTQLICLVLFSSFLQPLGTSGLLPCGRRTAPWQGHDDLLFRCRLWLAYWNAIRPLGSL